MFWYLFKDPLLNVSDRRHLGDAAHDLKPWDPFQAHTQYPEGVPKIGSYVFPDPTSGQQTAGTSSFLLCSGTLIWAVCCPYSWKTWGSGGVGALRPGGERGSWVGRTMWRRKNPRF